jgi:hypothetical protein
MYEAPDEFNAAIATIIDSHGTKGP